MKALSQAITRLDEEFALRLVREHLDAGVSPLEVMRECRKGVIRVGDLYSRGEYFLGDLILSGEILREIMEVLLPVLDVVEDPNSAGRIVFGTVEGDIHDIGKNITVTLLRCHGFEVMDLGVNVPPDHFVHALVETDARILGLSSLLTSGIDTMQRTVRLVRLVGGDKVKVMIGGIVNERVKDYVGADACITDPPQVVKLCKLWCGIPR